MLKHFVVLTLLATPAVADRVHDNYRYSSSTAINLIAPSRTTMHDTSNGTLTATNRGADVKFVFSSEGYMCKLTGKLSGHSIRFYANQSCTISDANMHLTAVLSAGAGTVDDDGELDLQIGWTIEGTYAGHPVSGTASERTTAVPL